MKTDDRLMRDPAKLLEEIASKDGRAIGDLLHACLDKFGGANGIAEKLLVQFGAKGTSDPNKTQIITTIIKLWMQVDDGSGGESPADPEDVKGELHDAMAALAARDGDENGDTET